MCIRDRFTTGALLEKLFHRKWWDYSDIKWNYEVYVLSLIHIWTYVEIELTKGRRELTEDDEREADALCKRYLERWREELEGRLSLIHI